MEKINCWEAKQCGLQPGGANVDKYGVCPAATATNLNGINDGTNGGRSCWAIDNTLCGGNPQGTYTKKLMKCMLCNFYSAVQIEESKDYISTRNILAKIQNQADLY